MCDKKCQYYIRTHARVQGVTMELNQTLAAKAQSESITENSILDAIDAASINEVTPIDEVINKANDYIAACESLKDEILNLS